MTDSSLRELASLVRMGQYDAAAKLAGVLLDRYDFAPPPELFELLLQCLPHSDAAKVAMATAYAMGAVPAPNDDEAVRLLEQAAKSGDEATRWHASLMLGTVLVGKGRHHTGLKILREAVGQGVPGADVALALAYRTGGPGMEPDLDRAIELLAGAVEKESPKAKVTLARLMLEEDIEIEGFDVEELLDAAAAEGDPEAADLIEEYMTEDGGEYAEILPYKVVPDGMKRPLMVKEALVRETGMAPEFAEILTARLHGFNQWSEMEAAAEDRNIAKGVFDEDLRAAEFNDRRRLQEEVLLASGLQAEAIAEKIVELLAPTARTGKPSLRRLEGAMENRLFPMGSREMEEGFEQLLEEMGMEGNLESLMDAARTMLPINSKAWLDALPRFGWAVHGSRPRTKKDGSLIGRTRDASGTEYDIRLSAVGYLPGDRGDEHVEAQMDAIAHEGRPAVLLFNRPMAYLASDRKRAILYGGRIFSGSEWWDFVLRPEGGIDDALKQRGKLSERPTSSFLDEYAFESALEAFVAIDAAVRSVPDSDSIGFVGHSTGWMSVVRGEVADYLGSHMMRGSSRGPGLG